MAQRGGAVHAQLRISDRPVASGLIPAGTADLVLSLEPMESLRYLCSMSQQAWLISDLNPHINIADYPELSRLYELLFRLPRIMIVDGEYLAKKAGLGRAQNMVLLGAASSWLPFGIELLEKHITALFGAKDQRIRQLNLKAFRIGLSVGTFYRSMSDADFPPAQIARVAARLDFDDTPPEAAVLEGWKELLADKRGDELARQVFSAKTILPLRQEIPSAILGGTHPAYLAVGVE